MSARLNFGLLAGGANSPRLGAPTTPGPDISPAADRRGVTPFQRNWNLLATFVVGPGLILYGARGRGQGLPTDTSWSGVAKSQALAVGFYALFNGILGIAADARAKAEVGE